MQRVKYFLEVIFATAIPHCCHIINVRFCVSIVEDFSGIDVNNNYVAVKKERKRNSPDKNEANTGCLTETLQLKMKPARDV